MGSRGAGEQGSRGAGEQGSKNLSAISSFPLSPSAPLPLCPTPLREKKVLRHAGLVGNKRYIIYKSKHNLKIQG